MTGLYYADTQYFNPMQVGGLKLWLDASDPNANGTLPSNNASISSWVDKSGNSNTVSQGSGSLQPIFKTNILNGKPVVRFDGVNDLMAKSSATALANQNTIFVVGTSNGNSFILGTFFDYSNNSATNTGINLFQEGTPRYVAGFYDGTLHQATTGATITLPATAVIYLYNDGANGYIYKNGTLYDSVASGNINNSGTRVYTIGALLNGVANYFLNGDVAEVIFYNSNLSSANKLLINRYLGNKWGISVP